MNRKLYERCPLCEGTGTSRPDAVVCDFDPNGPCVCGGIGFVAIGLTDGQVEKLVEQNQRLITEAREYRAEIRVLRAKAEAREEEARRFYRADGSFAILESAEAVSEERIEAARVAVKARDQRDEARRERDAVIDAWKGSLVANGADPRWALYQVVSRSGLTKARRFKELEPEWREWEASRT